MNLSTTHPFGDLNGVAIGAEIFNDEVKLLGFLEPAKTPVITKSGYKSLFCQKL